MKKKEKYSSFHEMKINSTSINPTNATEVMERHTMFDTFMGFVREEHAKKIASKSRKPTSKW